MQCGTTSWRRTRNAVRMRLSPFLITGALALAFALGACGSGTKDAGEAAVSPSRRRLLLLAPESGLPGSGDPRIDALRPAR
jgi:hypothetical protein